MAFTVFALMSLPPVIAVDAESSNPTISTGGIIALCLLTVFSVILLGSCIYQSRKMRSADSPESRILRCGGCRRAFRVSASVDGAEFMCTRCVTEGRRRMSVVLDEERAARFEKMRQSANKKIELQRVTSTFFKLARPSLIAGGSASSSKLPVGETTQPGTPESLECKICFDDESCIVLLPCGHGSLCEGCAKDLVTATKECYICRTEIELIAKIRKPAAKLNGSQSFDGAHVSALFVAPDTLHHLTSRIHTDDEILGGSVMDEFEQPPPLETTTSRRNTRMLDHQPATIVEEPTVTVETV